MPLSNFFLGKFGSGFAMEEPGPTLAIDLSHAAMAQVLNQRASLTRFRGRFCGYASISLEHHQLRLGRYYAGE
jgi:hypothetical protein